MPTIVFNYKLTTDKTTDYSSDFTKRSSPVVKTKFHQVPQRNCF